MYKYETHLHTYEASLCAGTHAEDYPAYYKSMGYSGIIVTDHFFNGNTRIPVYDDWNKRINEFCLGYEHAKEAGDRIGFPVFFGFEFNFSGDEFLIYGLDKKWLLDHPDLLSYSRTKLYDTVHQDGGLMVQAHPFRERGYLSEINLNPETCDAMEAYNAGNDLINNQQCELYCKQKGIFMTAGSDMHNAGSIPPEAHYGMQFETPLTDIHDYVRRILNREGTLIVPEEERRITITEIKNKLPVILHHRES